MKNQKEIDEGIAHIVAMSTQWSLGELYRQIQSLLQSEKDKWKAKMLEIIGEDEETSTVLYGASQAFIHRNQLRQQLRSKVEKL